MLKLGISSYTLTWSVGVPGYEEPQFPLGPLELIQLAADNDIPVVQIADNMPLHLMNEPLLQQLKLESSRLKLEIEVGTRGSEPAHLLKYLEIAKNLYSKVCRTLITSIDMEQAEKDIASVLPSFIEAGVTLAIENHGLHTTQQLITLFKNLNNPLVGSCLDTVNSFSALESPDQVIQALAPYIVNLHIKDFNIQRIHHQMGFEVIGTAAGSGRLDIPLLLQTLKKLKKQPNAILELWTPYTNSVAETIQLEKTWFDMSLNYLKAVNI
ncbi:hypothetical protein EHS13_08905 [Paenibacillus psychroresistens]|uniref:Xylose isomerase-like TIM barrel domain-containing protein n=1 Tax=Paenibacillus psychroresistens TaxID=1778678 RepID=A0A6B8RHI4_9BACL|nr:sugar phosphate isomerase/epimerase [Paenibacillus psychroresistens]QGQ94993.1 hypothetical protein EHS13_08905 [Paenibacillus psychroresistens]